MIGGNTWQTSFRIIYIYIQYTVYIFTAFGCIWWILSTHNILLKSSDINTNINDFAPWILLEGE